MQIARRHADSKTSCSNAIGSIYHRWIDGSSNESTGEGGDGLIDDGRKMTGGGADKRTDVLVAETNICCWAGGRMAEWTAEQLE